MADKPKPPLPRATLKSAPERVSGANEQLRTLQDNPPAPRFGADERGTSRIAQLREDLEAEVQARQGLEAGLKSHADAAGRYQRALGQGVVILARELGVEEQLPAELKDSMPPPPASTTDLVAPPRSAPPVLPALGRDAAKSARRANLAVGFTVVVTILEVVLEVLRHLPHH